LKQRIDHTGLSSIAGIVRDLTSLGRLGLIPNPHHPATSPST
jgi:hypothetical protein